MGASYGMLPNGVFELGTLALLLFIGVTGLRIKDLIQRGLVHRRSTHLRESGALTTLPLARVPCPECAEAILPQARRCPYCRSAVIAHRV